MMSLWFGHFGNSEVMGTRHGRMAQRAAMNPKLNVKLGELRHAVRKPVDTLMQRTAAVMNIAFTAHGSRAQMLQP